MFWIPPQWKTWNISMITNPRLDVLLPEVLQFRSKSTSDACIFLSLCGRPAKNCQKDWTNMWQTHISLDIESVANLRSTILEGSRSNFLHFHAVFREIWPNNRLATPLGNRGSATKNRSLLGIHAVSFRSMAEWQCAFPSTSSLVLLSDKPWIPGSV